MTADAFWRNQYLMDDCSVTKKEPDWDWKRQFLGNNGVLDAGNEWIELFLAGFYSFACLHETMLIHASAVKYRNRAVLFTAPSGTGKSTQAELWKEYLGAEILNGHRVFIRNHHTDGDGSSVLFAWGSPWAGSSPYMVNDCAEITSVVVLGQAAENSICRMTPQESLLELSANSFLPVWDRRCLTGMLEVMDRLLETVPIYRLNCRPDREAVEMVLNRGFTGI